MIRNFPISISSRRLLALAATALLHTVSARGASIAPNTAHPGIALGSGTTIVSTGSLAGTVLADQTVAFENFIPEIPNHPVFSGTLRSLVVQRADTSSLDFYYQLVNTTQTEDLPNDGDIFELTIDQYAGWGFAPDDALDVIYRTDGLTGLTGAGAFTLGTVSPMRGFRDPTAFDTVGFVIETNFLSLPPNNNLEKGETSLFYVVRTAATDFAGTPALVTGVFGATETEAYGPVPEPAAATLMVVGTLALGLRRRRAAR
jgi:hypothetical protein